MLGDALLIPNLGSDNCRLSLPNRVRGFSDLLRARSGRSRAPEAVASSSTNAPGPAVGKQSCALGLHRMGGMPKLSQLN
jgi:hypothetical protein